MATDAKAPRKRRKPGEAPPKAKSKYHLYTENGGDTLTKVGEYAGRNASEIIRAFVDEGGEAEGLTFVVIPDRNMARVAVKTEVKTKVKISAV